MTWARFDAALIADPARAPLPPVERSQYVYDWPSGYGLAEVTAALRQVAERKPVTVLRDQSSTPLREGLDLMLRGGGARIDVVDAPVKAGEFGDSIERLIASDRLVLLAIDQPAERQLVLSLDGRTAVEPWVKVGKPDGVREVAVYAVAGKAPPAAAPAGAAAVAASGGPGQGPGVGLWLLGRRDEAVRELAEALRLDTEDLRAGYNLAVARNAMLRGR